MGLGFVVATDIVNAALIYYMRGAALSQTTQDKPLLRDMEAKKKTFPSGNQQISEPLQGSFMSDTAGFFSGYSEDDQLSFTQGQNLLRAVFPWRETHAGLGITWSELKKDGITITENNKTSAHSDREATMLTSLMENRLEDFGESWKRAVNLMLWKDGTQDAKVIPGLLSLLTDTPAAGTTGGLNRATYGFWQHRVNLGIVPSAENQNIVKFFRSEIRHLRKFGGNPDVIKCGSKFMDALEEEVGNKGFFSMDGFKDGVDISIGKIRINGIGTFEYDPTLDDLGYSNRCYVYDSRRIKLRPMQGEENKIVTPERPYNYMVFFRSITYTGGMTVTQLNCNGVYGIAA